jgi:hypothetical protein
VNKDIRYDSTARPSDVSPEVPLLLSSITPSRAASPIMAAARQGRRAQPRAGAGLDMSSTAAGASFSRSKSEYGPSGSSEGADLLRRLPSHSSSE